MRELAAGCIDPCLVQAGAQADAPDARFVDEAGIVVEVDAAREVLLIGDVAHEQRRFPIPAVSVSGIAQTQAALEIAV